MWSLDAGQRLTDVDATLRQCIDVCAVLCRHSPCRSGKTLQKHRQTSSRCHDYVFMAIGSLLDPFHNRLGPRVKKIKNGYPESSKDCYDINLKKYILCIQNHCIASFSELHNATRAKKVW